MVQHFLVKGRVQGVGFRWFVHREAAAIGLRGWVRNTEDGHVEVLASGTPEQLQELRAVGANFFLTKDLLCQPLQWQQKIQQILEQIRQPSTH